MLSLLILLCSFLILSQFSGSSLFGCICLLLFSVSVFFLLSFLNLTWFALLFFLVYVGGLLVLFFYTLSINSNPVFLDSNNAVNWSLLLILFLSFLFFFAEFYIPSDYVLRSSVEDTSYFLFNSNESLFMQVLCTFLLYSLFVINKLTFDVQSAIRPISF